jgi:hypothetical protein
VITCILNPGKSNARQMIGAFAQGALAAGKQAMVVEVNASSPPIGGPGPFCFYGVDEVTLRHWEAVLLRSDEFFYIDNGYFRSKWQGGDYYRITHNAMQHNGQGVSNGDRWNKLDLAIHERRTGGRTVLVACQSDFWYLRHGVSKEHWIYGVGRDTAQQVLDLKLQVQVRDKSEHKTKIDWDEIYCVVTHSSNVAVDGLIQGVPCVVTAPCAARTLAGVYPNIRHLDWDKIETWMWAASLADHQWTVAEITQGLPWKSGID